MPKNKTKPKIVILTIVLLFLSGVSHASFAYSPNNTHPDLTKEMAELYNLLEKEHTFSQNEVDWMKEGAENEDKPARWINHFYDPIHKMGWDGSNFGNLSKEEGLAQGESLAPMKLLPSVEWVVNQEYQSAYGSQYGNRTWQRALHSYIDGDEKEAFVTLGHILHLIEDLSVPDHTRNDPHSGMFGDTSSPYEDYAKEYSNSNTLLVAEKLFLEKNTLMNFNKIQDAFEYMADYSNSSFFSADTINNDDYEEPNIDNLIMLDKDEVTILYDAKKQIYLSEVKKKIEGIGMSIDNKAFVLPSYIDHLFPKAVLVGASIIDLFFKEVEKYKENPESLEPLVPDSQESMVQTIKKSPKIVVLNVVNFTDNAIVGVKIVAQNAKDKIAKSVSGITGAIANFFSILPFINNLDLNHTAIVVKALDSPKKPVKLIVKTKPIVVEIEPKVEDMEKNDEVIVGDKDIERQYNLNTETSTTTEKTPMEIYEFEIIPANTPFFGGGGGGVKTSEVIETTETTNVSQSIAPDSPSIISPASSGLYFATSTITFSGTASSTLVISSDYSSATTTADSGEEWELTLSNFTEGTTTIKFVATNSNNLASDQTEISVVVDTTSPSLSSFSILQCDNSLVTSMCLSGGDTLNLYWTSTSTDISYYSIIKDGTSIATTTSTTSSQTLSNGTYSMTLVAYDSAGNSATSSSQSVEIYTMPIVINEIAWSGTASSSADEWIELYNRTGYTIDLSNVIIVANDEVPYINLSNTIVANGFYLIERGDDTATNVSADLAVTFSYGLSNTTEQLSVVHSLGNQASTTLDSTPITSSCSGAWCAGTASSDYKSMERIDKDTSGVDSTNWASNNTYTKNGADIGGNAINGTPRARNSTSLLSIGYYCTDETSSYISGGYYTQTSGVCTYLSSSISGNSRYGDVYKGTIASSTIVNGHSLGSSADSTQNDDTLSNPVQGENYFTAIYKIRTGPAFANDMANFRSYFLTGANAPPHLDYGIIEWKYGIAP